MCNFENSSLWKVSPWGSISFLGSRSRQRPTFKWFLFIPVSLILSLESNLSCSYPKKEILIYSTNSNAYHVLEAMNEIPLLSPGNSPVPQEKWQSNRGQVSKGYLWRWDLENRVGRAEKKGQSLKCLLSKLEKLSSKNLSVGCTSGSRAGKVETGRSLG